jgi:hypothetical protein
LDKRKREKPVFPCFRHCRFCTCGSAWFATTAEWLFLSCGRVSLKDLAGGVDDQHPSFSMSAATFGMAKQFDMFLFGGGGGGVWKKDSGVRLLRRGKTRNN